MDPGTDVQHTLLTIMAGLVTTSETYTVIKADGVDHHELAKVVLIWVIVAVPCNYIKRRVTLECCHGDCCYGSTHCQ